MKVYIGYIYENAWDQYDSDFEEVTKVFLSERSAQLWVDQYNSDVDRYDSRFYKEMDTEE